MKGGVRDRTRVQLRRRRWAFRKEGVGCLDSMARARARDRDSGLLVGGWCPDRLRRLPGGEVVLDGSLLPIITVARS